MCATPPGPAGGAGAGHPRVTGGCGPSLGHRGEGSAGPDSPMDSPCRWRAFSGHRGPPPGQGPGACPYPGRLGRASRRSGSTPRECDPINGSCGGSRAAGTGAFWRRRGSNMFREHRREMGLVQPRLGCWKTSL